MTANSMDGDFTAVDTRRNRTSANLWKAVAAAQWEIHPMVRFATPRMGASPSLGVVNMKR